MTPITINTPHLKIELTLAPTQQFTQCLLAAALSVAPAFIQNFLACLAQKPTDEPYRPGNRVRCPDRQDD